MANFFGEKYYYNMLMNYEVGTPMLEKFIRKSDLLVAGVERLCENKTQTVWPVLIPHEVDDENFAERTEDFNDYQAFKCLIIGFFGEVSPWFYFDLFRSAASARPFDRAFRNSDSWKVEKGLLLPGVRGKAGRSN